MIFSETKKSKEVSQANDEMAGGLLISGLFLIIGILFLAVSPIVITGFIIGLIWYGAYLDDGEPNGEKLIWPIFITVAVFTYLFGLFPPLSQHYQGILFTDFHAWTGKQIWALVQMYNEFLPRKFEIRSVTVNQVRIYCLSVLAVATAVLTYLHFRGAGRGVFLYRAFYLGFTPIKWFAVNLNRLYSIGFVALVCTVFLKPSHVVLIGFWGGFLILILYYLSKREWSAKKETQVSSEHIHLGHEKGKPHRKIQLSEKELNHHVHVVGASGFGKSVLLSHIISNRIKSQSGFLFVDLKADFESIRQVVSLTKSAGRLDDLAILSCGNPEISKSYNILSSGTANQLKDRLMGSLSWSEEFYKNEASSFLLKLLRGLTLVRDTKDKAFDLFTILKCIEDTRQISILLSEIPESQKIIQEELKGLISHLGKTENLRALQGLKSQLESLLLSDFGHLLKSNTDGIDLFKAITEKKIIYVLLDSRTYGESSKALGKLILQDLKAASARIDNELPKDQRQPFTVIVDEFADLASEDFVGFLDRARSSRIGVVVAHQEIADLSKVSPEFARRLMNSTSTLFAFLQKLGDASNIIAEISGTRKSKEVTEQAKENWLFGDEKTGMKSIKEVDEFVIHPNVVKSLGVGESVMIQKYPKARAFVMKVKPETTNYLDTKEVQEVLRTKTTQVVDKEDLVKEKKNKLVVAKNYWDRGL